MKTVITAVFALLLLLAPDASAKSQALMLNGIGAGQALPDLVMSQVLGGMFSDYNRVNVDWPQQAKPVGSLTLSESIDTGKANLTKAIAEAMTKLDAGEHVSVVGLSAGALVVDETIRTLNVDPSKIDFFVVGDSSRCKYNFGRFDGIINYRYQLAPETKYKITSVTGEFDGFADYPDRPNPIAIANALAGETLVHVPSMFTNISKLTPSSSTVNGLGGLTTNYLVKSNVLPLISLNPILKIQERAIRKAVEAGYSRYDTAKPASTAHRGGNRS